MLPPPELEIFNACVAGLLPPCIPLKARLAGLHDDPRSLNQVRQERNRKTAVLKITAFVRRN